ncbi:acyl-CoA thioesterase [Allocoprobacillus halotolerans]|uniref:Acyl-CoA thioesterase n=1 Tax=Allocoprobacillus halotolerans TaxID=2944914 RepID=A0ABY5I6S5_9FIRM|nr:acyl-CoA thioesterase [Allocoprobacillus halotolerans]UTY40477.1 acyl-CoA thioesterase [Allocoprobacillus halotolerans]
MQITHHSNYIRFMEEARVNFLQQIGFGYDKMEKLDVSSPVISIQCDYKKVQHFQILLLLKQEYLLIKVQD